MTISRILIEFEVEETVEPIKEPQPKMTQPLISEHGPILDRRKRRYSVEEDEWLLKRGNANKNSARAFKRAFGYKRTQKSLGNRLSRVRTMVAQGTFEGTVP